MIIYAKNKLINRNSFFINLVGIIAMKLLLSTEAHTDLVKSYIDQFMKDSGISTPKKFY